MPKKEIDYSKTVIYKIVCNDLQVKDCYVGSTTDFIQRRYEHKSCCTKVDSKKHNEKVYATINEHGGWNAWSMIEIEKYPCKDNNEARARERHWYEQLNATMNSVRPIISKKERSEYNSVLNKTEKYRTRTRKHHATKVHCACGCTYTKGHKSRHFKSAKHLEGLAKEGEWLKTQLQESQARKIQIAADKQRFT